MLHKSLGAIDFIWPEPGRQHDDGRTWSNGSLGSKSLMAWLAPTCTACRGWYFTIIKIMKGLVTPFLSLQSCKHRVLDGSYVELSVLISTG